MHPKHQYSLLYRCILLGATLLLAACGPKGTIRPITQDTVVMAFGDSLTAGVGASHEQNYPSILSGLLGIDIINEGISGETTSQGLARLPDALENDEPDLVLLCMGGNDMLADMDHENIRNNLETMIRDIKATGADVILIGVPKPGLILGIPDFYEELADTYQLPYDDTLPSILSKNHLKSDYIHPNAKGYQILAEALHELIKDSEAR